MTPSSCQVPSGSCFTDLTGPDFPAAGRAIGAVARFALGRLLATPGALATLTEFGVSPLTLFIRHSSGDWGELDEHDRQVNELAVLHGDRILSAYALRQTVNGKLIEARIWVLTEASREATTILLPSEY